MAALDTIARFASAAGRRLRESYEATDQPGPEIRVSPFRPGEVTGEAIALKSIAALIAGRRAGANAREKREKAAADLRYRDLLSQQIERKLAEPAATMYEVDVPGVGKVPMTGPQAAGDARARAAAAATATYRDKMDADRDATRADVMSRFDQSFDQRERQVSAVKRYQQAGAVLKDLDAEAKREAQMNVAANQQQAAQLVAVIRNLKAPEADRARAASKLGVDVARGDDGKALPPVGGRQPYDLDESVLKAILATIARRAGERAIQRTNLRNRSTRSAAEAIRRGEAGIIGGQGAGADPLDDLRQLLMLYEEGAVDEEFLDQEAQ